MPDSAENIARSFVRAINRQDVEQLIILMTPAHRFVDSIGHIVEGREKMRAGWAAYFKMVPNYSIAVDETICDAPIVLLLGVAEGTYTSSGELLDVNRWRTPVAIRAQIEDDMVAEWRVYADNEPLRALMRKPASDAK